MSERVEGNLDQYPLEWEKKIDENGQKLWSHEMGPIALCLIKLDAHPNWTLILADHDQDMSKPNDNTIVFATRDEAELLAEFAARHISIGWDTAIPEKLGMVGSMTLKQYVRILEALSKDTIDDEADVESLWLSVLAPSKGD
jgi:hypothetical protein